MSSLSRSAVSVRMFLVSMLEFRLTKDWLHPTSFSHRSRWMASWAEMSWSDAIFANRLCTVRLAGRF